MSPTSPIESDETDDQDRFLAELNELHQRFLRSQQVRELLRRIAELATLIIPNCDFASVVVVVDFVPISLGLSDPALLRLSSAQFRTGMMTKIIDQGLPSTSIFEAIPSTNAPEDSNGEISSLASSLGLRSMHARPFHIGKETWALFTVYSASVGIEAEFGQKIDDTFSSLISIALEASEMHARASSLADQLQNALRSRSIIDEAKGILMARYNISPEEAFQRMIKISQSENRKLREVAADLVRRTQATQAPRLD